MEEPRSFMREALVSLMESHSHCIVCSVRSTADMIVIASGAYSRRL